MLLTAFQTLHVCMCEYSGGGGGWEGVTRACVSIVEVRESVCVFTFISNTF